VIPAIPAVGIRFDIGKITSGAYGIECWRTLWRAVEIQTLGGCLLFEGDTAATLRGTEKVYCIAIQSPDLKTLQRVVSVLKASGEFQRVAASPPFTMAAAVTREPLSEAGRIDAAGDLVGGVNSRTALVHVHKERGAV